ncbi:exodeoxyribonuclease V subunit alpha [Vibrio sp. JC009]|uniref:exodeoxyribonuclease V subunit alpha n=1 Tax=Vibrio sp. JC009 TaxID=2912314 RepID=UPI0023B078ED|nr:exodeoxyribonuclease V subunit alpha [Vibrio sp. JC009]WED21245.1 exodeoxyribonuclease V subunit alpha [Vibrio sp. JC009]
MLNLLQSLAQRGAIRQLDYQFARFIASHESDNPQAIGFIAGVLSAELSKGHICMTPLEFNFVAALGLYGESARQLSQQVGGCNWAELLEESSVVGGEGDSLPLIFDGKRLYLQRYWHYEMKVAEKLQQLSEPLELKNEEVTALRSTLDNLFKRQYHYLFYALQEKQTTQIERQQLVCDYLDVVLPEQIDWSAVDSVLIQATDSEQLAGLDKLVPLHVCMSWQKVAAAVALNQRLAVISGGPGTGKTTTVAKLLAVIADHSRSGGKTMNIKLVAPTGKAAARLTESLGNALRELPVSDEVKALIPTEAGTIHRLLGAVPNRAEFRHNQANPLHLDLLVVDEASMVDLPMMYKLLDALPQHARLVLLGDKDQLSSVEAGAVLGDICSMGQSGYSQQQGHKLSLLTGFAQFRTGMSAGVVSDSLCMLQKSYRFDARSGIGQLAKAVNRGASSGLSGICNRFKDIDYLPLDESSYKQMLKISCDNYTSYLKLVSDNSDDEQTDIKAKSALKQFSRFRVLCAVREGDFGVAGLNQRIEKELARKGLIYPGEDVWYPGRPVMITRNDYSTGLYNGDIGICLLSKENSELKMKVYFELPDGEIKAVLPSRVPDHETAYAMTIHKSQGSEFENPLILLPGEYLPVLTRELIYTGITRAKKTLTLVGDSSVLVKSVNTRTERMSGLMDKLN